MTGRAGLTCAAVGVLVVAWTAWEVVRLRGTNRAWISHGAVAGWRAWRTLVLRVALWFLAWPHLLDRVLRTHRVPATATTSELVAGWPGASLHLYRAGHRTGAPVVIVHSLVTRPWILDLAPGCSLVEALTDAGRDVYLLDWDDPDPRTATQGLAEKSWFVQAALNLVAEAQPGERPHLLGYCSGATIALITAAASGASGIGSLALVAPVVDTSVPGGMRPLMAGRWLLPPLLLDQDGCVPAAAIREGFHLLRPMALRAARQRWRLRHDPEARRIAGALTRWTWEQRKLGGGAFFDLVDLFRHNHLMNGGWPLGDRLADVRTIATPTLLAVTDRDHIVPVASSLALEALVGGPVETVRCSGGHVSMVAGLQAQQTLYPSLVDWFTRADETALATSGGC